MIHHVACATGRRGGTGNWARGWGGMWRGGEERSADLFVILVEDWWATLSCWRLPLPGDRGGEQCNVANDGGGVVGRMDGGSYREYVQDNVMNENDTFIRKLYLHFHQLSCAVFLLSMYFCAGDTLSNYESAATYPATVLE